MLKKSSDPSDELSDRLICDSGCTHSLIPASSLLKRYFVREYEKCIEFEVADGLLYTEKVWILRLPCINIKTGGTEIIEEHFAVSDDVNFPLLAAGDRSLYIGRKYGWVSVRNLRKKFCKLRLRRKNRLAYVVIDTLQDVVDDVENFREKVLFVEDDRTNSDVQNTAEDVSPAIEEVEEKVEDPDQVVVIADQKMDDVADHGSVASVEEVVVNADSAEGKIEDNLLEIPRVSREEVVRVLHYRCGHLKSAKMQKTLQEWGVKVSRRECEQLVCEHCDSVNMKMRKIPAKKKKESREINREIFQEWRRVAQ